MKAKMRNAAERVMPRTPYFDFVTLGSAFRAVVPGMFVAGTGQ
jgi:hypothetical protein